MQHYLLAILLFISLSGPGQQVSESTSPVGFINQQALQHAIVSISAIDLENQQELMAYNARQNLTPASVLKLLTSATALELLGCDYHFETSVGYKGSIEQGRLKGNLLITGGGDPTLGSGYFASNSQKDQFLYQWAALIRQAGIDTIDGDIVADPGIYSDQDVPQTWIWEDLGNYFGAAARGLAIYDNTFELVFETADSSGGPTKIIKTNPFIPQLELRNEVRASTDQRDRAYVYGSPFDSFRIIRGTLPLGQQAYSIKASVPDPALLLASELKRVLENMGITVSGKAQGPTGSLTPDSLLFKWTSPPLSEIVNVLNHESVNLYAEHLCKQLGLQFSGEGSTRAGLNVIEKYWTERNVDTAQLYLADGSGLSRVNALSASTLTRVLEYMYHNSPCFDHFYHSVPLTGLEGTQQYYFQHSFLKGKARAKSGSMTRVRSFAGYLTSRKGTEIAFAIIINNFDDSSFGMAKKMEALMELLYNSY